MHSSVQRKDSGNKKGKSYKDLPFGRSGIIGFHEITNNKNGIRVIGNQYFKLLNSKDIVIY